jgi:hypothetical protein
VSCSEAAVTPKATGTCSFGIPANLTAGAYELRLLANDGYSVMATSKTFTVISTASNPPVNGPTISAVPSRVTRGTLANVSWSGIANPFAKDWIALYTPGVGNSSFLTWFYVSCQTTASTAKTSGSCAMLIPITIAPGSYELRLFSNDGYSSLAISSPLTVR